MPAPSETAELSPSIALLKELVALNSVNPFWGGPGEQQVASSLLQLFHQRGIEAWESPVPGCASNVYALIPGRNRQQRLIFEAHMDTVSAESMTIPPFEPTLQDGRLYGRGACDVKAGLAAMVSAFIDLKESGEVPPVDLWLAAVVDEEYRFRGVNQLIEDLHRAGGETIGAIVAEPTENQIVTATNGVLRFYVTAHGICAHSSKPHLGKNAILDMLRLVDLYQQDAEQLAETNHPLTGRPSMSVTLIEGGQQINFIPERCRIGIDRRLIPGETAQQTWDHYRILAAGISNTQFEVEQADIRDDPMETPHTTQVVSTAVEVARNCGLSSVPVGVPFGCDASKLSRAGIPSLVFGPGSIDQAHAAVEYVVIEQVLKASQFYRTFLQEFGV
ncbi:MAG: ArgE/DapE family deacylase [Planctomycetaceae bacterium]|nr:ArgE/DapE family deacylase [Planctomycetaceae bacterium]